MELVHRKISHTMRNFAWCAKFFGCLKWFRMVCEISYNHAKMLVVGFLPLVFFLASLIGLEKGYEVFQSLDSSCVWALTCIAMDFTKFFLILGLFQWSNSYQKTPKLAKNWLVTLARFLNVPIELKGINYYSKVFKIVSFKI